MFQWDFISVRAACGKAFTVCCPHHENALQCAREWLGWHLVTSSLNSDQSVSPESSVPLWLVSKTSFSASENSAELTSRPPTLRPRWLR
jgi:hypothetical protein